MVAVLGPLGYVLVLYAVRLAPISHVAPAREVSMLFAALIGGRLLGEGDRVAAPGRRGLHRRRRRRAGARLIAMQLAGIDFTSAPSRRKPITVALGRLRGDATLSARRDRGPCRLRFVLGVAALARAVARGLRLSRSACRGRWSRRSAGRASGCRWCAHYTGLSRAEIRATFQAFCAARPVGDKFAHRACDAFSTASPSMKWVNPPVAFMLHAGIGLLLDAGVQIATLHPGDPVAGRARRLSGPAGARADRPPLVQERHPGDADAGAARARGSSCCAASRPARAGSASRSRSTRAQRAALLDDGSADRLDAVLCLMQAAWAAERPGCGLPDDVDPLEGWIVSAIR